jgi:pSer/pThr/pTyr-binding forkhead associated (FHA) protein
MLTPIIVLLLRIFLVGVLYVFLGWTIYTLWKDLRLRSQAIQVRRVPTITLIERSGMVENKEISFEMAEVSIGRDQSNSICIDEDIVSNRHALLNYRNGQWWIEDLLSTNGTYLNDEKVDTPTILISGDEVHIGNHFYEIRMMEPK